MATGYFVHGAFAAGVKLPRHGLESAGVLLPRGAVSVVPAGAFKGGRLAVVVTAAAAASGGSHDGIQLVGCFNRYALVSTGAPPRQGNTLAPGIPTNRRLAVVVAAAGAGPGGSDDDDPLSADREASLSAFRLDMETFKVSQCQIAFVPNPTPPSPLLEEAFSTAVNCTPLVELLLSKEDVHPDVVKELGVAGKAFLVLEEQAGQGYMRADALVNCIEGMKLVRRTFFKDGNISEYPAQVVPPSADLVDKEEFFVDLVNLFVMYFKIVYASANRKYGFGTDGGI